MVGPSVRALLRAGGGARLVTIGKCSGVRVKERHGEVRWAVETVPLRGTAIVVFHASCVRHHPRASTRQNKSFKDSLED